MSEEDLKALFGWTRSETAAKYTKKAQKKGMAIRAAQALRRDLTANAFAHTGFEGVGNVAKTPIVSAA